jgi:hypothetical protein
MNKFLTFLERFRVHDPLLVESIIGGYQALIESDQKTQLRVYRGDKKLKSKFDVKDNIASSLGKGIYVSDKIEVAKAYATKYLYVIDATLNNPLVMDWRTDESREQSILIEKKWD